MCENTAENLEPHWRSNIWIGLWNLQSMWHTFKIYNYYLFNLLLAALGLCCYMRAFCSCGKWRLLSTFSLRWRLLLQSMGCRARGLQYLWCMGLAALWDLPVPGLGPTYPALVGRFLTTGTTRQVHVANILIASTVANLWILMFIWTLESVKKSFRFKFGKWNQSFCRYWQMT